MTAAGPASGAATGTATGTATGGGVHAEPFYLPVGDEVTVFTAAYAERSPVLLKGPTGCGKTRFLEHMAWRLAGGRERPLTTIACHEDLTASDLVGRYLLNAGGTTWVDGPLTQAVRNGGICYLDEVVEARTDTVVVIHSLTDHRRLLPIAKRGETITAHDEFLLVVSYNPGYQSTLKDLKPSTRQRFVAIEFDHPDEATERRIIAHEASVDAATAATLASLGRQIRNLDDQGLVEGPSTRLLIYAGRLIRRGVPPRRACRAAIVDAMTDDGVLRDGIAEVVAAVVPE
ncbi:MAG: AAA domain-containing protein [Streptosporangiales bacterium]|nr:AAA domain-containing protein [Streptosporangiales bacterium]